MRDFKTFKTKNRGQQTMETDQFYTSEQRVRQSLSHRESDYVPFDLGATGVTGIHSPLEGAESVEKVDRHPWPDPEEPTRRIEELAPGGGLIFLRCTISKISWPCGKLSREYRTYKKDRLGTKS